ncbi:hypothetical protein B9Z07_12590 [Burkholderia cenocepacia]|uniref:Uncharacterized protein n=2 Tax=Burkholderia TaxID=32008 RepID=A0AAD0NCD3_9BURK|nr:hypothetical protein B9Z07_12590 [Burkholderia cenocepacia]PRE37117.1 hypothetical protein C6P63_09590 [Burkholderia cenocepacia]
MRRGGRGASGTLTCRFSSPPCSPSIFRYNESTFEMSNVRNQASRVGFPDANLPSRARWTPSRRCGRLTATKREQHGWHRFDHHSSGATMSQVSSASHPTVCEDWSHFLPGFTLTHTVHLVSRRNPGIVSTAAAVLEGETATVDRWAITRCGDVLEQKIVLGEMTEGQAVRLRERLAALDGVLRTRVEHHFVRGGSASLGNASESGH